MTARTFLQVCITIFSIAIAAVHLLWPTAAIDGITLTLILVAVLPWVAPLFKSVELPGGVKVEFQELEKARERADKAGLLVKPQTAKQLPEYSFQIVANEDPNLALAGLRIEIEKRLLQIAKSQGIDPERKSAGKLLQLLAEKQLITFEARSVLADMLGLLNSAVHGAVVDPRAASWAMEFGPRLLKSLDERILP